MFNWLRELKEIWQTRAECSSCEVLKVELSNERREKEMFLRHVLTPKSVEPERLTAPEPIPLPTNRHIPWKVRQQMLEAESREKARAMAEFKNRDAEIRQVISNTPGVSPTSIEELEANLGIVQEK